MLIVTPTVLLCGVTSLWNSTLNSEERFAASGLVPVLTPLFAILAMFTLGGVWGIRSLAIGILMGALAELFLIGWILHRGGHRLIPIAGRPSKEVRQVLHQYLPLVVAAALMSSTTLVDNAMASELGSGSVATLSYGRKLVALAISLPVLSISRAIFPYFLAQVATRNWSELRQTLARSRWAVLLTMIPLAVILFSFRDRSHPWCCNVERFGRDTEAVAWVQAMYAIQIPFYTLSILYVRLISSMRLNYLLTMTTVISIILNVVLNYVLMQAMGVAGIALSTSLVFAVSCGFLAFVTHRALRNRQSDLAQADCTPSDVGALA